MKTNVYKIVVMVIDHDQVGGDEVKLMIEETRYPNRCISPQVKSMSSKQVEWPDDDSHPLNRKSTCDDEFQRLFATP